MEAGPVSAKIKGSSRFVFFTVTGFDFDGGHLEDQGISPTGELVDVPQYRHQISVDFTRIELEYDYTFKDNWDIRFRLPYEIKRRKAGIEIPESASTAQQEAMKRSSEIHHDSETLTGLSDIKLIFFHRKLNLLRDGDSLDVGFGTSVPVGDTEPDPFEAGDAGLRHEHIQFGTGTFDPLLELYYTTPLAPSFTLGAFFVGRYPIYENNKTYQGPLELASAVHFLYGLQPQWILRSTLTGYYQGYAHWDGIRDINSGLWSLNLSLGTTFVAKAGLQLSAAIRYPLVQETFDDEGDAFEQGPTFLLSVSRSFRPSNEGENSHAGH